MSDRNGNLSRDDRAFLALGKEIARMIRDVQTVSFRNSGDLAYARRGISFPDGEVTVIIVNRKEMADKIEAMLAKSYHMDTATPPSEVN